MKNKCNNLCNFFPTVIQLSVSYKNLIYNIEDGYAIFILLQMVSASWHMQSVLQISEYQNMQICTDLNLCSSAHLWYLNIKLNIQIPPTDSHLHWKSWKPFHVDKWLQRCN